MTNQQLAGGLHNAIIRKFEKQKVNSSFKENIWSRDLADTHILNKYILYVYQQLSTMCHVYFQ